MNNAATDTGLVCHVNLASGFRGGERQTQILIEELAARGYRQRLVARRGKELAQRCAGIKALDVCETSSQPVLAAFAARGTSVVHAHEARAIYACWLASRWSGARFVLTRRVDNPFKPSPIRDRAYRAAACRVAVSNAIARQIRAAYGAENVVVVADAHADMASRHRRNAELAARFAGKTVIGHVGALDHSHKGQLTIIDAARQAATTRPELLFVLVGDGRDEQAMRAAAAGLPNVVFAGFVTNVADWLDVFDVFVFPSLHEGLGSTLLDAMSFGLPVVASNVGGIPDIVQDGETGLLIAPERPAELLAAVTRIIDDESLGQRLVDASKAQAQRFGPAAMADRYAQIYGEIR